MNIVNKYRFDKVVFFIEFLYICCLATTNIGFLNDDPSTSSALPSNIDIKNFLTKIDLELTDNLLLAFNTTCKQDGMDFDKALQYFSNNKVTHIFTHVIFKNFTEINEKLIKFKMVIWSTTPQLFDACHSNIMYFGSFRRYAEMCINNNCVIYFP